MSKRSGQRSQPRAEVKLKLCPHDTGPSDEAYEALARLLRRLRDDARKTGEATAANSPPLALASQADDDQAEKGKEKAGQSGR
jgi:hypothetical protein